MAQPIREASRHWWASLDWQARKADRKAWGLGKARRKGGEEDGIGNRSKGRGRSKRTTVAEAE